VIFAALMGLTNGYVNIISFTWMQANTPENMMGRVMSLIMFASVGLNPIAMAVAGVLVKVGIIPLFVGCGVALTVFTLAGLFSRELRRMGYKTQFGTN
jgi:MFS family permease